MKISKSKTSNNRLILAIDPAEAAGVAVLLDGKLVGACPSRGDRFKPLYAVISDLVKPHIDLVDPVDRLAVIEGGWLGRNVSRGGHTLAKRRGIAESAAEAAGFDRFGEVSPNEWRKFLFNCKPNREEAKKLAFEYCEKHYQIRPDTDDVAEAICLAAYFHLYFLLVCSN